MKVISERHEPPATRRISQTSDGLPKEEPAFPMVLEFDQTFDLRNTNALRPKLSRVGLVGRVGHQSRKVSTHVPLLLPRLVKIAHADGSDRISQQLRDGAQLLWRPFILAPRLAGNAKLWSGIKHDDLTLSILRGKASREATEQ